MIIIYNIYILCSTACQLFPGAAPAARWSLSRQSAILYPNQEWRDFMEKYWEYIKKTLLDLLAIPSPSGYTDRANAYISGQLQDLGVSFHVTNKGAIVATIS